MSDVSQLEIELLGMSASEVASKMQGISLPSLQEMDESIRKANDATESHAGRVEYLNVAIGIVKTALSIAV